MKEQWAAGAFHSSDFDDVVLRNSVALGEVKLLEKLEALDYEELVGGLESEPE